MQVQCGEEGTALVDVARREVHCADPALKVIERVCRYEMCLYVCAVSNYFYINNLHFVMITIIVFYYFYLLL